MESPVLPDKLSDLLELAVRDAQAAEASPRHVLSMVSWHQPGGVADDDRCAVCMAGAVMAMTLRSDHRNMFAPCDFNYEAEAKLDAINFMRVGDFIAAAELLGVDVNDETGPVLDAASEAAYVGLVRSSDTTVPVARRGRSPWSSYLAAARVLREGGL